MYNMVMQENAEEDSVVRHDTILISGSSRERRATLREIFKERFNLLEAETARQTMLLLRQNIDCMTTVLLDMAEWSQADVEILQAPDNKELLKRIPIIVISKNDDQDMMSRAFGFGAADVIPIGYDPYAMLRRVETIVDLYLHKQHLENILEEQTKVLRNTSNTIVDALASIIEYRSVESGQHILRIRQFTKILLEEVRRTCPAYGLTEQSVAIISSAAALHDIGKIAIPDSILMKPGRLTDDEWKIMETHSLVGCRILDSLSSLPDKDYLRYAHNICRYHHERWDGHGYPEGLAGEDIPICAQVVGLADAYDALTTSRTYKDAFSFPRAVNMILRGECGAFSPKLLECFERVSCQYEDLARAYAGGMPADEEIFEAAQSASKPMGEQDAMERLWGKYYALAHYINGFLIELDLDKDHFRLMYNPYPELAAIQQANSLEDIEAMVLRQFVHPDDRERMADFLREGIAAFLRDGLRRANYRFRMRCHDRPEGENYALTLMRINPLDSSRRTLVVLARKEEDGEGIGGSRKNWYMAGHTYCCRNDEGYTLAGVGTDFKNMTGYTAGEIFERFSGRMIEVIHPEDREAVRRSVEEQLRLGTDISAEYRIINRAGDVLWVMDKSRLVRDEDGVDYLYTCLIDITPSKAEKEALEKELRKYEQIMLQTGNILFEWDVKRDEIMCSEGWEHIFGFQPACKDIMKRLQKDSCFHPDDIPLLGDKIDRLQAGSDGEMIEARISTSQGRYLWCRIHGIATRDQAGKLEKISGTIINIDEEKKAEQRLQSRADRDSLTKLLNKEAVRKQAEGYFARYPDGPDCALLIIDLDNFKQANDQYGHLFGDAILAQVSRQIRNMFRSQDIVARIGGDEFLVLARGISDRILLEQRCRVLQQNILETISNKRYRLSMGCSIGIALSPVHGKTYYELYQCADQALYQAKARGKNCYTFYNDEEADFWNMPGSVVGNAIDSDAEPGLADDHLVRYIFGKLYSSPDTEAAINEILAYIGKKMNVSRVYVFENSADNRFCSNTYEWCNDGIRPEMEKLQRVSYESDIPGYENNFNENGIFYCSDISGLPEHIRSILAPQGIKSMLQCAVREKGIFRGYIGFDECVENRLWTQEEITLLTFFSESLSMFLLKMRQQEKVQQQADELASILENQNAWIYVMDPETRQLQFVNGKMRAEMPGAHIGQVCYRAVMGKDTDCKDCPIRMLRQSKHVRKIETGFADQKARLMEGTRIRWNGKDAYLISCRELP